MFHFFQAITNTTGDSLVGYYARVVNPDTLATITLYSDISGTPIAVVSGVQDMARTDDNGNLSLFVEPGTYHLDIYQPDSTTFALRVPNVPMNSTKGDKGDQGVAGDPGPANSTYATKTAIAAAPTSNLSAIYAPEDGSGRTTYTWTLGDFSNRADAIASNSVSLTTGAWLPPDTRSITYGRTPLDYSLPITLAQLGVMPSTGDVSAPLRQAIADANGDPKIRAIVADANTVYRKDGSYELSKSFDGQGCVLRSLSDAGQALTIKGGTTGLVLKNVSLLSASIIRDTTYEGNGLAIGDQGRDPIVDVWLENITVDGVEPGRGPGGTGFWFANVRNLRGFGLIARNSRADGFHFVHGARHCRLYAPIAENVGDDGVAVVSYVSTGLMCEDIEVHGAYVFQGGARGVSCVGGRDVWFLQPRIDRSSAAAVYINSEDAFDTFGCLNVHAVGVKATNCAQGGGAVSPGTMQAVLLLGGRAGGDSVDGYPISRSAVDCSITGDVYGAGPIASQGFTVNNQYVVRPRIDVNIEAIPANIPGALLSGEDWNARVNARDIGGVPVVVEAGSSGRCLLHDSKVDRARQANPGADTNILLNNATAITELRVERSEFNNTSGNLVNTDSGFDLGKLRYRAVKVNGSERGKDYATGTPAYISGWSSSDLLIARYADGRVTVKGAVSGGTGRDLLNLPAGFRPPVFRVGTGVTNNGAIVLTVDQNTGKVSITSDPVANEAIFLDLTFEGAN